jgi:hypothetical protein
MEPQKNEVVIEPILKLGWIERIIQKYITRNRLITSSLRLIKVAFKVTLRNWESIPDTLVLHNLVMRGPRDYVRTFEE